MEFYVAGGCSEHGRNCFLVKGESESFLVDAGIMKEKPEMPFPELSGEQIRNASYLFLTHCHADHSGAIQWLLDRGFHGEIIASEPTFKWIRHGEPGRILEKMTPPLKKCRVDEHLKLTWGRSGHCIGAVWYLFQFEGKRILFTGDYTENSFAFKCDKIRHQKADLAVIDCAYGNENQSGKRCRASLERGLDELTKQKIPLLFPCPSHGRGLDIIRLLSVRDVNICLPRELIYEALEMKNRQDWLKKGFVKEVHREGMDPIEDLPKDAKPAPGGYLVIDSQLYDREHQELAQKVLDAGGRVVLTGKQDPKSFSRKLLDEQKADFLRIPVHQTSSELLSLRRKNAFKTIVPYHSRKTLKFEEEDVHVMKAGEALRI